jgi:hypothetical protein
MGKRLNFLRQLFQRDQGGGERLGHHPFVMAGNPLLWHARASCRVRTGQLTAISGVWEKLEAVTARFGIVIQEFGAIVPDVYRATLMTTASVRPGQLTQRP